MVNIALANGIILVPVFSSTPFHLRTETDPVSRELCSFRILDDGQSK
jgi:hypothetical protein